MSKKLFGHLFPLCGMSVLATMLFAAAGCAKCPDDPDTGGDGEEIVDVAPETEIFISEAAADALSQTIDDPNTALPITVSLGKALKSDVTFTLDADAKWLADYNAAHDTDWILLPETGRQLTIKRTIPAGETVADPVVLNVTLPSDANSRTYVLPVTIADVWGAASIKESKRRLIYLFIKGNFVYFEQTVSGGETLYKVPVDGPVTLPFDVNLVDEISSDLTVTLEYSADAVNRYNEQNGTNLLPLPAECYTWASGGTVTIPAGAISASADVVVNSLPSGTDQYAVGLRLVSVKGGENIKVKADQNEWVYMLRGATIPAIQHSAVFTGFTGISGMPTVAIGETLPQWTFEYWVRHDDNSKLNTSTYNWLDATSNTGEWRKRVYPPQSAPAKLPSPIDFKFWPQAEQPLSPMMQFTQNQMLSASIHNDGFAFMPDEWTHLAFTYDSSDGTFKYYVNGVQYGFGGDCKAGSQTKFDMTTTYANAVTWGTLTLATPGASGQTFYQYYKIEMAQMRLWSRVLEGDEIAENMGCVLFPEDVDGLVVYWKMDEGDGKTLHDAMGSGRDITSDKISWSVAEYDFSSNNGN